MSPAGEITHLMEEVVKGPATREAPGSHRGRTERQPAIDSNAAAPAIPAHRARGMVSSTSAIEVTSTPHCSARLKSTARSSAADSPIRTTSTDHRGETNRIGSAQHDGADDRGDRQEAGHDRLPHEQREGSHCSDRKHRPNRSRPTPTNVTPGF